MSCLFAGDYGAPDANFDPLADNRRLLGYDAKQRAQLVTAKNLAQFQAMERKFAKGESVTWCENGYAWVYEEKVGDFFGAILAFVILPWLLLRVAPALARRLGLAPSQKLPWARGES